MNNELSKLIDELLCSNKKELDEVNKQETHEKFYILGKISERGEIVNKLMSIIKKPQPTI